MAQATDKNETLSRDMDQDNEVLNPAVASKDRGVVSRGLKRRRVIRDDEDRDDHEIAAATSSDTDNMTLEPVHDEPPDEAEEQDQPSPKRLVILSVKVSSNTFTRFAVSENTLRQIPEYSRKLDTAIVQTPGAKRLRITDTKIRREEVVTQAIEYVSDGILEPLDVENGYSCLETLTELVYLYDFAVSLSIEDLQHAIVEHVAAGEGLAPETFVSFAVECYREGKDGHKVTPDCLLGQFIKKNLADHLPALVEGGAVNDIKEIGGTLNKQLVEVFMEDFMASKMKSKRSEGNVKIEIKD